MKLYLKVFLIIACVINILSIVIIITLIAYGEECKHLKGSIKIRAAYSLPVRQITDCVLITKFRLYWKSFYGIRF